MNTTKRPFIGSEAVAAGAVTAAGLRGPRYRSPFRGIHVDAEVPDTYAVRCEAGFLTVRGVGALAGYAAAEMQGAECAPARAPVELVTTRPPQAALETGARDPP